MTASQEDTGTGQTDAAAERSADPNRGSPRRAYQPRCCVCGGPWRNGPASFAARGGYGTLQEVCSAECAAKPPFASEAAPSP